MKYLLALETSGKAGSVAVLAQNGDLSSCKAIQLPTDVGSAQTLVPSIAELLRQSSLSMSQLGCIALPTGPGSFTGLRVGVATAKAIAYARKISVVELDTLEVIADQLDQDLLHGREWVHCILDAYRGQLFVRTFRVDREGAEGTLVAFGGTRVVDIDRFLEETRELGVAAGQLFAGPGCQRLLRYWTKEDSAGVWSEWGKEVRLWDGPDADPQAETVARLAIVKWQSKECLDPFTLKPHYYRGSAAEEKVANRP